jgi:uncharacterized membrane protein HdeD (DUF308 family)
MSEIEAFKTALNEAGQPWSRWGVRVAGAGILALLALQIIANVPYAFYALILAVGVIAVGWVLLIVAMVKRRRWAKDHPIEDVALDIGPLSKAP